MAPIQCKGREEEQELKLLKPRTEAVLGFGYRGETTRDVVGYVDNIPCTTLREPQGRGVGSQGGWFCGQHEMEMDLPGSDTCAVLRKGERGLWQ